MIICVGDTLYNWTNYTSNCEPAGKVTPDWQRVYLRFGVIPQRGFSLNHATKTCEKGISVYHGLLNKNKAIPIMPKPFSDKQFDSTLVTLSGVLNRPLFVVTGTPVGFGSDGEPLLENVKTEGCLVVCLQDV